MSITDPKLFFEYVFREMSEYDIFGDKEEFAIRVLSEPQHAQGLKDAAGTYIFMGRILDDGAPSPHMKFLTDPCDIATTDDPALTSQMISLHTRFSFYAQASPPFTVGDVIYANLDASLPEDGGGYDLQFAKLERVKHQVMSTVKSTTAEACAALKDIMQNQPPLDLRSPAVGAYTSVGAGSTGTGRYYQCKGSGCGKKDDPTFAKCAPPTYSSLPKKSTEFKKYSAAEVIAAIRASGQPEGVQKIMYVFLKKEQGKLSFPNNNVAGIQLDSTKGFKGTTQADFDYQTCFRDGGGDQRIFAGFDTLENGMKVFGKIVNARMGVFKTPTGASVASDAEVLTWNYYRSWNLVLSPEQLTTLKNTGKVTKRSGKTYKKNWSAVVKEFSQSLNYWNSLT